MEYLIKTNAIGGMTEEQFYQFCQENDSINFERNALGDIMVMEPTGSYTGWFNMNIGTDLTIWNRKTNLGFVFDSNAGFTLPNQAVRAADVAFIIKERWAKISVNDRNRFAHICPDFVIELLSKSDHEPTLRKKMEEWIANGCRLAWMINPQKKETTIYRSNGKIETTPFHNVLDGEDVLPGFTLELTKIYTEE